MGCALIDKAGRNKKEMKQSPPLCPGALQTEKSPKSRKRQQKSKTSRIGGMSMIRLTVEEK